MTTKKGIIERHDFISELVLEKRISSRDELFEIVKKNFFISMYTLEKDLKHIGIGYSADTKCYTFKNRQDHKIVTEKKLKTILMNAGLKTDSEYKIYSPMIFSVPFETPKIDTATEKPRHILKLDKPCIYNVLITCKIGYEQSVYNVINEKILTDRFISAQINIGSVNFLFNKNGSANKFYRCLNTITSPKK